MIEIGWTSYKYSPVENPYEMEWIDNVYFEPERLSKFYEDSNNYFKRCPANAQFLKNFFIIRAPFDLTYKLIREENKYTTNQNMRFNRTFIVNRMDEFTDKDLVSLTFSFQYLFVADEPVIMEVYPPFLHGEIKNTRLINGSINIFKWQRPIDFSFEMLNDKETIEIKRGQPMMYVKFIGENLDEDFKLKKIEWTEELMRVSKRTQILKWVENLSAKILKKGNNRPKKLVK